MPLFKICCLIVLSFGIFSTPARAGDLWLQDIPVAKLQNFYRQIGYEGVKGYLMLPSHRYPAVFLKNFPADYNSITDEAERNAVFIKILAPLALKLNEDLLTERQIILDLAADFAKNSQLSADAVKTLEAEAEKYDVFSRLTGNKRYSYLLSELSNRIDRIPPSIMITAAMLETNFGTSRIVKEGNSLYKTLVWHTDDGLKPVGETEDDSYRIKTYPDIYASMQDFALKINSHPVFSHLRNFRRERRERTANISGILLAPYVYGSSALKNYAGIFDYTLAYYELLDIDKSQLNRTPIPANIMKSLAGYVTKM